MGSGPVAPLAAVVCFLLAALAHARGWRAGAWLGAAGAAILAGALAGRGLRAGRWPLANEYEFALALALSTALVHLALLGKLRRPSPSAGAATWVVAASLVAYARLGMPAFKRVIQPIPPALRSIWLPLHVGAAALGYGALLIAGMAGLLWLVREPERNEIEGLLDDAVAAGYPFLTLSMLLGMVWAQAAWGRYWGWDLKESWTLITWLVFCLYWHLRRRPRWRGRGLAWLALAGAGAVLFTFLGVSWLARQVGLESLHLF